LSEPVANRVLAEVAATKAVAFQRLAAEHLDESYRLARAILGSRAEAEDATHDAFEQAWRRWSSLRDPDRFEAWFARILVNSCRDRLRTAARRRVRDLSPELARATALRRDSPDPFGQTRDRMVLGRALADLSPDHRLVVALRFYRDLSAAEIARLVGTREGTVHSRLHYALRHLRAVLERPDEQGPSHD
jgi:RNA polymerase sigma-70 factor (ECF subfamily)